MRLQTSLTTFAAAATLLCPAAAITTIVDHPTAIQVDFNAVTGQAQAGWTEQAIASPGTAVVVSTTALGTSLGIGATLNDPGTWETRSGANLGGNNRITVSGSTYDNLWDGLLITRDGSATLDLTGLSSGQEYRLLVGVNDNHRPSINPGFANGGGVLSLSVLSGATAGAAVDGLITNNSGDAGATVTDADFTLATLSFTATGSAATIDFASTNPNGFMPIAGLALQVVPEPSTALLGGLGLLGLLRRRRR